MISERTRELICRRGGSVESLDLVGRGIVEDLRVGFIINEDEAQDEFHEVACKFSGWEVAAHWFNEWLDYVKGRDEGRVPLDRPSLEVVGGGFRISYLRVRGRVRKEPMWEQGEDIPRDGLLWG